MDRLSKKDNENWRFGRVSYLEKVCAESLSKLSFIMKELRKYAFDKKLRPSWITYKKCGKGKNITLSFSKTGSPNIEKSYATHYLNPKSSKQVE